MTGKYQLSLYRAFGVAAESAAIDAVAMCYELCPHIIVQRIAVHHLHSNHNSSVVFMF
jgi:hypothetical protein